MVDEKKLAAAKEAYSTLCTAIEEREWKYKKNEEKLTVFFGVNGEDIPMDFFLAVDVERQLIRLLSPLPFTISEEKRVEGAIAICAATYGLVDGSFDYDISEGRISFRMTASFRDCRITSDLFHYMISMSCAVVDRYNDRFLALDKGMISFKDFLEE